MLKNNREKYDEIRFVLDRYYDFGWSPLFGQGLGGFHENQDPQGSSGSATAAAMNLAAGTLGCEVSSLKKDSLSH